MARGSPDTGRAALFRQGPGTVIEFAPRAALDGGVSSFAHNTARIVAEFKVARQRRSSGYELCAAFKPVAQRSCRGGIDRFESSRGWHNRNALRAPQ
jgi:hypothetical protein